MSSEYPDVLGDLVDARRRFEVNGVQYVLTLQPSTVAPGEIAVLRFWLQSCWDVPVDVLISFDLPVHPSPGLLVAEKRTVVPLEAAEVGEVTIPIACSPKVEPGRHVVPVAIGIRADTRGLYVRSQESGGQLGETLLAFTTGMDLSSTMGLGFTARPESEHGLRLKVTGSTRSEGRGSVTADLAPTFVSHWTTANLLLQGKARTYVNDQRLFLLPQLTRAAIYRSFLEESQERYQTAGLPLHLGEAIFLAKILTATTEYFLKRHDWQDAVLVPAYKLAYRYDLPVNDAVFLVTRADYARMTRLAMSLSFGLVHRHLGHDLWTTEEQLALADLVSHRVERGGFLPAEFLYLPLLLGGLLVGSTVKMPGEDLDQSLNLLDQARQKRSEDLAENPELINLLEGLLAEARSGS
jgi:hypothetical protein